MIFGVSLRRLFSITARREARAELEQIAGGPSNAAFFCFIGTAGSAAVLPAFFLPPSFPSPAAAGVHCCCDKLPYCA